MRMDATKPQHDQFIGSAWLKTSKPDIAAELDAVLSAILDKAFKGEL